MSSTIEFLLLVVGVFMGFQFDRWNEGRLHQQEANEYSIQLLDDMSIELRYIDFQMNYYEKVRAFGLQALTAWEEPRDASAEELVIAFYQASNITPRASVRGSYDALSSKGLLGLVGGPEFGSSVSAYYSQELDAVVAAVPYRMEVRGLLPNHVQQAVRDNCAQLVGSGLIVEVLADDCAIGLSEQEATAIIDNLRKQLKLQFYLRQSISKDSLGIYLLGTQRESLEKLRAELQAIHDARR